MIREAVINDAEALMNLISDVESESPFMLYEKGERTNDIERQRNMIKSLGESKNSTILVADIEGELGGYLLAIGGGANRNKHSAYLVIGIQKKFRGQGVGTQLFLQLFNWGERHNIHRLELTVMAHNEAGIALYKKMGFEVEGIKKDSLIIDGVFINEYYMSKILNN